ncbi:hypothetical protein PI124_g12988 [Phytophthora idaei]|nr:hypothetical protein PI125_g12280 [Phytophthora idaei]KAG3150718.1 hypothetical protein PI126_g11343 [Phytophthora idaei]KAG3242168.1 hypothetical protein PI124_g12988 [Phytophthora idaei]
MKPRAKDSKRALSEKTETQSPTATCDVQTSSTKVLRPASSGQQQYATRGSTRHATPNRGLYSLRDTIQQADYGGVHYYC